MSNNIWFVSFVYYIDSNPFPKFGNYTFNAEDSSREAKTVAEFLKYDEAWPFENFLETDERKDVTVISISKIEKG